MSNGQSDPVGPNESSGLDGSWFGFCGTHGKPQVCVGGLADVRLYLLLTAGVQCNPLHSFQLM